MGAPLFAYLKNRQQMLRLLITAVLVTVVAVFVFAIPSLVYAQERPEVELLTSDDLGLFYAEDIGLGQRSLPEIIASIIRIGLGLLGIIAVVVVIAGGVM